MYVCMSVLYTVPSTHVVMMPRLYVTYGSVRVNVYINAHTHAHAATDSCFVNGAQ